MTDSNSILIRDASSDDLYSIAHLHAESWRNTYRGIFSSRFLDEYAESDRLRIWNHRLCESPSNQRVLVALQNGSILGFLCLYANENPERGSLVDNLHVLGSSRGCGIGTRLLRSGAGWLHSNCPNAGVYLWVLEENHSARKYYEHLGAMSVSSEVKENPGGGSSVYLLYQWENSKTLLGRCRLIVRDTAPS